MRTYSYNIVLAVLLAGKSIDAAFQVETLSPPPSVTRGASGGVSVAPPPPVEDDYNYNHNFYSEYEQKRSFHADGFLDDYSGNHRIEYGYGSGSNSARTQAQARARPEPQQQFQGLRPSDEEFITSSRINNVQYGGKRQSRWDDAQAQQTGDSFVRYERKREPNAQQAKASCQHFQVDNFIDDTRGSNRMVSDCTTLRHFSSFFFFKPTH